MWTWIESHAVQTFILLSVPFLLLVIDRIRRWKNNDDELTIYVELEDDEDEDE